MMGVKITDEMVNAACKAVILGVDEREKPVHLSREEARAALEAAITAPDKQEATATARDIDSGRFDEWSTAELSAQCKMQSREQMDPEFSQFMAEVGKRLQTEAEPVAWTGKAQLEANARYPKAGYTMWGQKAQSRDIPLYLAPARSDDALRAENERLREALTRIACLSQDDNLLWWQVQARAALTSNEEG
jgi:hypothetical protein